MDWVPIVFITFKFVVIGTALYFSIKTHRDNAKKEREEERERQERARQAHGAHAQAARAAEAAPGTSQAGGMSGPGADDPAKGPARPAAALRA